MFFDFDDSSNNRAAALLAVDRYSVQLKPWVRTSKARLAYVDQQLKDIVAQVSAELEADPVYVENRLRTVVAEQMEGLPSKSKPPADPWPGATKTDVMDHTTVDEHRPKFYDLNQDLQKFSCFRCDGPRETEENVVCQKCNSILSRLADFNNPQQQPQAVPLENQYVTEQNEQVPHRCLCGATFPTKELAMEHAHDCPKVQEAIKNQQAQAQGTRPQQPQLQQNLGKTAQPQQPQQFDPTVGPTPQPTQQPAAPPQQTQPQQPIDVSEGLSGSPPERFTDVVQDIANRAGAVQYSVPSQDDINAVAQQQGLDPSEVESSLMVQATFGEYTAINGELGQSNADTGDMTEVTVGNSNIPSQEALVPTGAAIKQVASDLGARPQYVEDMVKGSYGDVGLPDKWHASVSGQRKFFLPKSLVGSGDNSQVSGQPEQAAQ